jgi:ribosomal-protein-alanine N-acetyltransferase
MLETERLILRAPIEADLDPFAAMSADPEVMRHFPGLLDREAALAMLDRIRAAIAAKGYGFWAVERKADGAFLGLTGVQDYRPELPLYPGRELGWRLARHAWGQGYASEAAKAALDFTFDILGADRVSAITATGNLQSQAVMRRIGMTARPELDFDHPLLEPDSPLLRHVVYMVERPS